MNKLQDVFKLSGIPTYTFVRPQEYLRLSVALDTAGRGLIIEGPSGIGKTTSVIKALRDLMPNETPNILSARKPKDLEIIKQIPDQDDFGLVIIDDFHRLDQDVKTKFADLLKVLADNESTTCKLVIIGINKTGQPLLAVASDLRNRIDQIKFESNPEEKVLELLELGESALNINLTIKADIAANSQGSFHIAQMLAHRACLISNFSIQLEHKVDILASFELVKEVVLDELSGNFYELAKILCTGRRIRTGSRAPYLHVLFWLSQQSEWAINIRNTLAQHPDHKQSVSQIIDKGYLKSLLNDNPRLEEVIFYDDISTILSIEDPKFFYYIKNISWSNFARNIGFPGIEFKFTYDYALSFAGAQRELAEKIFQKLTENEISVFYDENEQHRMLGMSVEEYLAPIYKSVSRFVVVLLSTEYPHRIWCKFESDNFRNRFGENAVIPIWFPNQTPTFFDATSGVGGLSIDGTNTVEEQAHNICETLILKIHELRIEDASPPT